MGEIHFIIGVLEINHEREGLEIPALFLLETVGFVGNVPTAPKPALPVVQGILNGVLEHFHTVVIQRIRLNEIYDVQTVVLAFSRVTHFEIKPLCVRTSVIVRFEN